MSVLVTGATGHLGTELVPLLAERGHVRVLSRDPPRARRLLGDAPEFVAGDARDPRSLAQAMHGVETVVSAMTGFGPGGTGVARVDYKGTVNVLRAAEDGGVQRFVYVSMHGAAADHPMELLRVKQRAEDVLTSSRLAWTIVRPNVFMELWLGIVGDPILNTGKATIFGRGDNPINFNSVRDVARFVDLAAADGGLTGAALDVGGSENVTLNEMVRRIERAVGRKARVRHVPLPLMRLSTRLLRPLKPDIAGMIEGGIAMDTVPMTFDAAELRRRYPSIELTPLADVIDNRFGSRE